MDLRNIDALVRVRIPCQFAGIQDLRGCGGSQRGELSSCRFAGTLERHAQSSPASAAAAGKQGRAVVAMVAAAKRGPTVEQAGGPKRG